MMSSSVSRTAEQERAAQILELSNHLMKRYESPTAALRVMVAMLGTLHDLSDAEGKAVIMKLVAAELSRMRGS